MADCDCDDCRADIESDRWTWADKNGWREYESDLFPMIMLFMKHGSGYLEAGYEAALATVQLMPFDFEGDDDSEEAAI